MAAELLGRKRPMILAAVLFLVSAVGFRFPEIGFAPIGEHGPGCHLAVHRLSRASVAWPSASPR